MLDFILAFVPSWFKPAADGTGEYAPVLWQLFPAVILGCPLGFLMCLYWELRHFWSDFKRLCAFIARPFLKYRFARGKIKFLGAERFKVRGRRARGR